MKINTKLNIGDEFYILEEEKCKFCDNYKYIEGKDRTRVHCPVCKGKEKVIVSPPFVVREISIEIDKEETTIRYRYNVSDSYSTASEGEVYANKQYAIMACKGFNLNVKPCKL